MNTLLPKHGGYRRLKTFQLAQLIFDITVRFCEKFISSYSRTNDQMVQAARSGVQNIAEGSQASGTSKKTELKLTNVARASLEELKLDYQDFLRQNNFVMWEATDPRLQEATQERFASANQFAKWVKKMNEEQRGELAEIAANGMLVLLNVTCLLLDRQIASLAKTFQEEGGFTERLYRLRMEQRKRTDK